MACSRVDSKSKCKPALIQIIYNNSLTIYKGHFLEYSYVASDFLPWFWSKLTHSGLVMVWLILCQHWLRACCLYSTKSLPEPMLTNSHLDPLRLFEIWVKLNALKFFFLKMHLKMAATQWQPFCLSLNVLTHWGWVTHICVGNLTIIGSDNDLSPGRRQAIIWTNAGILLIGPLGINFSEILIEIITFSFYKMLLKVSSAKRRPFCFGLNVLTSDPGAESK